MLRAVLLVVLLAVAAPSLAQDAEAPPSDPGLEEAFERLEIIYEVEDNGDYRLVYGLENGRNQIVWIRPEVYEAGTVEVREVFSYAMTLKEGAPLPSGVAERLLVYNHDYILGAWARGGDRLVFSARMPPVVTDDELLDMISIVMFTADEVEQEITGQDEW